MSIVSIEGSAQFETLLKSSTVVVADFYADWCGPCKQIAPVYQELATKFSKPRAITFTKVNVDTQQSISQKYGVRAMPTFMIFRNGQPTKTIRGADRRGLTEAVSEASKYATAASPLGGATGGHVLGSAPRGPKPAGLAPIRRPMNWSPKGLIDAVISFIGLYLISLFSLNGYKAAEESMFNIHNTDKRATGTVPIRGFTGGGKVGTSAAKPPPRKFGTLSDLNGSED